MAGFFRLDRWALSCAALATLLTFLLPASAQTVVSPAGTMVFDMRIVSAIAVQPDGKVIIGGGFSYVNGVPRNMIARLNTDGSVDMTWNPNGTGGSFAPGVYALLLDGAGSVYVAGAFDGMGGQANRGLAKVSISTGLADPAWSPADLLIGGSVDVMALDGSGLYVAGTFSKIGGLARAGLARLSTSGTGAADATWNPNPLSSGGFDGDVAALALDGGGNLYVGGSFATIGGQTRNNIAKLSTSGSGLADATWNPNANGTVESMALSGSSLFVGGNFSTIGGQSRIRIAKLSTAAGGLADPSWNPVLMGSFPTVYQLVVDGASVYASGAFTGVNGQPRMGVAKLATAGAGAVDAWNASSNDYIYSLAFAGGRLFAGGGFSSIGGQAKSGFANLSGTTGAADPAWPMTLTFGEVNAVVRDSAGRMIVGGLFVAAGPDATARGHLARFNADGSLDATWSPNANDEIDALAIAPGGDIYAGGRFTTIGGQSRSWIAKLSPAGAGAADAGWNPNPNGPVEALAVDGSGLYAGGGFTSIGGQSRNRVAKLTLAGAGTADATWNPNADGWVNTFALDGAGSIFVGGDFANIGGQARSGLAKASTSGAGFVDTLWNPAGAMGARALALSGGSLYAGSSGVRKFSTSGTGAVDFGWAPSAGAFIMSLAADGAGNLYVGGEFNNIGGLARRSIAKFSTSGGGVADAGWNASVDLSIRAIAFDAGGNVCLGGRFRTIAGQPRVSYSCITATAPAIAPAITSANATTFLVGSAGTFTVTATGTPTPTLSVSGTLPAGVSFDTGTGVLSGTPASGTVGSYPLTFSATNSQGTANQSFTLTVAPNVPGKPVISSIVAGANQATINFPPPPSNGSPIVSYKARCSDGSTTVEQTASAPPIVVTGLTNGVPYTCTVDATNGVGDGPQSDPSGVTPGGGGSTPPTTNLGSLAFGGQSMGTTSPATELTITNPNASTITITGIALTSQFGQSNNCTVLAAQASCKVFVTFSPAVFGGVLNATVEVTGTLTITTSAGNLTVNLGGTAEKSLVTHYYRSILRRAPDSGGHAFWSGEAARVAALGANVNETWFALAATFYRSGEYVGQNRNVTEYVRDLYNTFYNRAADDGGLTYWTGQINAGLPREVVLLEFMFSAEFASFTGAIFGNANVRAEINTVVDFYRGLLGRLPDGGGFNFWVGRFRTAQCQGAAAVTNEVEAISSAYALSGEYGARARDNTQYVTDLYNAFLRRGGDLGGFNFWVNQIAGGFRTREQVRIEFKNSPEFQGRVNAIINQGCMG